MERFYCLYYQNAHPYVWVLKKTDFGNVGYFQERVDAIDFFRDHYQQDKLIIWYQNDTGIFEGNLKYHFADTNPHLKINELNIEKFKFTAKNSLSKKYAQTMKEFYIDAKTLATIPYKKRLNYNKKRTYILENKEKNRLQKLNLISDINKDLMDIPHFYVGDNGLIKSVSSNDAEINRIAAQRAQAKYEKELLEKSKDFKKVIAKSQDLLDKDLRQLHQEVALNIPKKIDNTQEINKQREILKAKRDQIALETSQKLAKKEELASTESAKLINEKIAELEKQSQAQLQKKEAELNKSFERIREQYELEVKKYLKDLKTQKAAQNTSKNKAHLSTKEIENLEAQKDFYTNEAKNNARYREEIFKQNKEWEKALRQKSYDFQVQLHQQSAYYNQILYNQFVEQYNLKNYLAQQQYLYELERYRLEVQKQNLLNNVYNQAALAETNYQNNLNNNQNLHLQNQLQHSRNQNLNNNYYHTIQHNLNDWQRQQSWAQLNQINQHTQMFNYEQDRLRQQQQQQYWNYYQALQQEELARAQESLKIQERQKLWEQKEQEIKIEIENLNNDIENIRQNEYEEKLRLREAILAEFTKPQDIEEVAEMAKEKINPETEKEKENQDLKVEIDTPNSSQAIATSKNEQKDELETESLVTNITEHTDELEAEELETDELETIKEETLIEDYQNDNQDLSNSKVMAFSPSQTIKRNELKSKAAREQEPLNDDLFLPQSLINDNLNESKEWVKISENSLKNDKGHKKFLYISLTILLFIIIGAGIVLALFFTNNLPNLPSPL